MKKRVLAVILALCMVISMLPAAVLAADDISYTDVKSSDWFYDDVQYVTENGLMVGTDDGTFSPNATLTRATVITVLYRLEGEPAVTASDTFSDVAADQWYTRSVAWAAANGIGYGYGDTRFGPNDSITREQFAAFMHRYADYKGYDISGTADLSKFHDANQIRPYAEAALSWANSTGLIVGRNSSTLDPGGNATRAEAAAILTRFCKNIVPTKAANCYTVTFQMNDAGSGIYKTLAVNAGTDVAHPDNPELDDMVFAGWYTDAACTQAYEFRDNPITHDLTLYARWVDVSDTTDSDEDLIPDTIEDVLETDAASADSDHDGLDDYTEIYVLELDPLARDTDGDGVSDGYEDSDGDNLINRAEVSDYETNPADYDTDEDALNDDLEILTYHTDPLNADTDGDGASDGIEVQYGKDPLTADASFDIHLEGEAADDAALIPSVDIILSGEQVETLAIGESAYSILFPESMPGYIGSAYDFSVEGDFDNATISFTFDADQAGDDFVPVIYWFNEDTQQLEQLATTVQGNVASAAVTHFSTYILLNQTELTTVIDQEILAPSGVNPNGSSIEIVYVIDYSESMNDNDPDYVRLDICDASIRKLPDGSGSASVIKFAGYATTLVPMTTDKEMLINAVDGIVNTGDDSCSYSDAGTNGTDGIHSALQEFSGNAANQYIVFLTDGEDTTSSYNYDDLTAEASERGIIIYTIGMGSADEAVLTDIAEDTGGKYYHASVIDEEGTDIMDLSEAFADIESNTIDKALDSNADGISDYYTDLLCQGKIRLGTGAANPFAGIDYESVQANADYDGDGLTNGEEIVLSVNDSGAVYMKLVSDPTKIDSDDDGLYDNDYRYVTVTTSEGTETVTAAPVDPQKLSYTGKKNLWKYHISSLENGETGTEYDPLDEDYVESVLEQLPQELVDTVVSAAASLNGAAEYGEDKLRSVVMAARGGIEKLWYIPGCRDACVVLGAYFLNFVPDEDGTVYHSQPDTWQRKAGYNQFYDTVFRIGSNMKTSSPLNFTVDSGTTYALWMWEGYYWNLRSGAEIGIYEYTGSESYLSSVDLYDCIDFEVPSTLSLYYYYNAADIDNVFNWYPTEDQWWCTGFNPSTEYDPFSDYQNMVSIGSLDFSDHSDMYQALRDAVEGTEYFIFDDNTYTVWTMW